MSELPWDEEGVTGIGGRRRPPAHTSIELLLEEVCGVGRFWPDSCSPFLFHHVLCAPSPPLITLKERDHTTAGAGGLADCFLYKNSIRGRGIERMMSSLLNGLLGGKKQQDDSCFKVYINFFCFLLPSSSQLICWQIDT